MQDLGGHLAGAGGGGIRCVGGKEGKGGGTSTRVPGVGGKLGGGFMG